MIPVDKKPKSILNDWNDIVVARGEVEVYLDHKHTHTLAVHTLHGFNMHKILLPWLLKEPKSSPLKMSVNHSVLTVSHP